MRIYLENKLGKFVSSSTWKKKKKDFVISGIFVITLSKKNFDVVRNAKIKFEILTAPLNNATNMSNAY
jgi:hypothetical protein